MSAAARIGLVKNDLQLHVPVRRVEDHVPWRRR